MSIPQNLPMSPKEIATAAEVFEQYEGLDMQAAWEALRKRALDTDRPFRAYDCAHAVAGCLQPADKADEAFQAWQRIFEKSRKHHDIAPNE